MKLVIQIPCWNEEATLPQTVADLPAHIDGIDEIEVLIIDDGSTDETVHVANELGVHHICQLPTNRGLAVAFSRGLEASLAAGADIIVNTDGDNQYVGEDIAKLVQPVVSGEADIVIGDRDVAHVEEFSPLKRQLQRLGSWVVKLASGVNTTDATSGFRAFSREAAMRTYILTRYSYTLESLIQAGANGMKVQYVPVRTNESTRPSRLMRGIPDYIMNSSAAILRSYTMYSALRVFLLIGAVFITAGFALGGRFLWFYFNGRGDGNVQSLILTAILFIVGFQTCLIGLVADLIGFNRKILEQILYHLKRDSYDPDRQG